MQLILANLSHFMFEHCWFVSFIFYDKAINWAKEQKKKETDLQKLLLALNFTLLFNSLWNDDNDVDLIGVKSISNSNKPIS